MDVIELVVIVLVGLLAGFINVVAGGGSLITLPVLISFIGLDPTVANASNRVGIVTQNVTAIQGFRSKGVSTWPFSLYLGIAALLGAVVGAVLAVKIPDNAFNKILAIVMIIVVITTVFNPSLKEKAVRPERLQKPYNWIAYFVFFFIGIYGGFIQAGTGLLIMSALTIVNHYDLVKANSAKAMVALIYTFSAIAVFIYSGKVDWFYGIVLGIGNAAGGWFASVWSVKKGNNFIKWFMIVAVTFLAINLWQPDLKFQLVDFFIRLVNH